MPPFKPLISPFFLLSSFLCVITNQDQSPHLWALKRCCWVWKVGAVYLTLEIPIQINVCAFLQPKDLNFPRNHISCYFKTQVIPNWLRYILYFRAPWQQEAIRPHGYFWNRTLENSAHNLNRKSCRKWCYEMEHLPCPDLKILKIFQINLTQSLALPTEGKQHSLMASFIILKASGFSFPTWIQIKLLNKWHIFLLFSKLFWLWRSHFPQAGAVSTSCNEATN